MPATRGTATADLQYDAMGRRSSVTLSGQTSTFAYRGNNPVRISGSGQADLVAGLGLDNYITRTDGGATQTFLTDILGNTVALADATGAVTVRYGYEPFGKATITSGSSTNQFKFTGREDDGTGLDYLRARYYSPTLQRFLSEDHLGFAAGDANFHVYAYDDPLDYTDRTGMLGLAWDRWREAGRATYDRWVAPWAAPARMLYNWATTDDSSDDPKPYPDEDEAAGAHDGTDAAEIARHAMEAGRFKGRNPGEVQDAVAETIARGRSRELDRGRTVYWEPNTGIIVIHDPSSEHRGTAFEGTEEQFETYDKK